MTQTFISPHLEISWPFHPFWHTLKIEWLEHLKMRIREHICTLLKKNLEIRYIVPLLE